MTFTLCCKKGLPDMAKSHVLARSSIRHDTVEIFSLLYEGWRGEGGVGGFNLDDRSLCFIYDGRKSMPRLCKYQ
jgi:hypothetical protein